MFDTIKASWDQVDQSKSIKTLDGDLYNKEEAVQFYKKVLLKRYKQSKFSLGETPPNFTWKNPGAAHIRPDFVRLATTSTKVVLALIRVATFNL